MRKVHLYKAKGKIFTYVFTSPKNTEDRKIQSTRRNVLNEIRFFEKK